VLSGDRVKVDSRDHFVWASVRVAPYAMAYSIH